MRLMAMEMKTVRRLPTAADMCGQLAAAAETPASVLARDDSGKAVNRES
jgi:hypothetical protein